MGAMSSIVNQIWDAVATQIAAAAGMIIGTALNLIKSLQSLITSALLLLDSIVTFFTSLKDWAKLRFQLAMEESECANFMSAIAACLLNKYLGPYLDEFTDSIVGKINEFGNNFNEALY
jgi:hypothetical protein